MSENKIHVALAVNDPKGTYSQHAGVVITSLFENTKIETPKTSDNRKLLIWATLLALSLASITGIGVYEHKKRKMNNK